MDHFGDTFDGCNSAKHLKKAFERWRRVVAIKRIHTDGHFFLRKMSPEMDKTFVWVNLRLFQHTFGTHP